jgi:hypothetical protein
MEAGVRNYPVTKASSGVVGRLLKDGKSVVIVMWDNGTFPLAKSITLSLLFNISASSWKNM